MISLKIISLLLAVSLVSAFNVPEQGNGTLQQHSFIPGTDKTESAFHPRIINGEEAKPNEFKYQVGLEVMIGQKRSLCGGSLISHQWVLTAGQCIPKKYDMIFVQLGMLHLGHPAVEREVGPSGVFRHFNYSGGPPGNIVLIKIAYVEFGKGIYPIDLPKKDESYDGATAVASGWGYTTNSRPVSYTLRFVTLTIISNSECAKHYGKNNIDDSTLCTGHSFKGICISDTGGPLTDNNQKVLIGITTFVAKEGCGKGFPDGFTRVAHYLDWIQDTRDINGDINLGRRH